jgi:hypothetical protein
MRKILRAFYRLAKATDTIFLFTNLLRYAFSRRDRVLQSLRGSILSGLMSHYMFHVDIPDGRVEPTLRTIRLVNAGAIPEFTYPINIGWGGFYSEDSPGPSEEFVEYSLELMAD